MTLVHSIGWTEEKLTHTHTHTLGISCRVQIKRKKHEKKKKRLKGKHNMKLSKELSYGKRLPNTREPLVLLSII